MRALFVLLHCDKIYKKNPIDFFWFVKKFKDLQTFLLNPRPPEYMLFFGPKIILEHFNLTEQDLLICSDVTNNLTEDILSSFRTIYSIDAEQKSLVKEKLSQIETLTLNNYGLIILLFCDPLGCGWYPIDKYLLHKFSDKVYVMNGRRRIFNLKKKYLIKIYRHRLYRKYVIFQPMFLILLLLLLPIISLIALSLFITGDYRYGRHE